MWLKVCENVSVVLNIPLLDTFDLDLTVFLNIMSYVNHKNNEMKNKHNGV